MDQIDKKEAIQTLEDGMDIRIELGDDEFIIGDMHNYIGAPENESGYISEYLGNVWYADAEHIINETINGMTDGNKDQIKNVRFYID